MKHDSLCFGGIVKNSEPPIMPLWWNWQTQGTQNPSLLKAYRFESGQGHHSAYGRYNCPGDVAPHDPACNPGQNGRVAKLVRHQTFNLGISRVQVSPRSPIFL